MMSTEQATITNSHEGISIHIPMSLKRRGGRKEIILPEGMRKHSALASRAENALIRAVVRGHYWKDLLESGRFDSITELAKAVGVNGSYVGRHLNLTLLAPDIVGAIIMGREPDGLSLEKLYQMPLLWGEQRKLLVSISI